VGCIGVKEEVRVGDEQVSTLLGLEERHLCYSTEMVLGNAS